MSALLSHEQTLQLISAAQNGDEQAKEELIEKNIPLVKSIVKGYLGRGTEYEDLFQLGSLGLLKAILYYDASFEVRFSTYAVPMILGEIKRFLRDGNSLRVSRSIRDTAYRILKVREGLEEKDEEATIERIAREMQVKEREVVYALDAISDPVSLYDPVYNKSGDTLELMDQLYDETQSETIWTERVALREAMNKLGERERKILLLRYFEGKTQTEISAEVGISQAQVSRLEKNALGSIRKEISY